MGRSILAVVGGYLVMAAIIVAATLIFSASVEDATELNAGETPRTWVISNFLISTLAAVVGGYVCGLIARRNEIKHGLALAIAISVVGVLTLMFGYGTASIGYDVALIMIGSAAAIAGGYLRAWQVGRPQAVPPED